MCCGENQFRDSHYEPRSLSQLLRIISRDRVTNNDAFSTRLIFATYRIGRYITQARANTSMNLLGKIKRTALRILLEPTHRLHLVMTTIVGCDIPYSTQIGQAFRPVHGFHGIFLSTAAKIGDHVVMLHQVTIGSNNHTSLKPGAPTIGNRVFIGAGAKIIGPISVGDDARIGANAIVVGDVPPGSTAISPKAVIRIAAQGVRPLNSELPKQRFESDRRRNHAASL